MAEARKKTPRKSALSQTHPAARATEPTAAPRPPKSVSKMTVNTTPDVINAAKNAWWVDGRDRALTYSGWIEEAILAHVHAAAQRAGVQEFPPRPSSAESLPVGRPIT